MELTTIAAVAFAVTAAGAAAFQVALAAGAPWGEFAMGGRFPGRFPTPLRVAAVGQAVVLLGLGTVVLARAGLAFGVWGDLAVPLTWGVVGFSVASLVLNAITPSVRERLVWVPVALVMLATSLTVALTAG